MSSWDKVKSYRQELTNKIIGQLENNQIPWERPWGSAAPYNPASKTVYNGINRLSLSVASMDKGYSDPRWCTFKQAQANGWKIKQGEKASGIEYWQWTKQEKTLGEDGKETIQTVKLDKPICQIYSVFNASQIEGMPPLEPKEFKSVEMAEQILKNSGAVIEHNNSDRAYYSTSTDKIVLPNKDLFKSVEGYYGTALHELAHWTGHETRLNRDMSGGYGSENYAKEELRAELASSFINHELGTTRDTTNTAAYIQSWVSVLKNDSNEIFKAAYDADKISTHIMEFSKEKTLSEPILRTETPAHTDIIINVPREIKDDAKELGAKWNATQKTWYIPKGTDITPLSQYLPDDGKMAALKDTPLFVPYAEKDNVKGVAHWDNDNKTWYLPAGEDIQKIPSKYFEFQRQPEGVKKSFEEFAAERGLIIEREAIADGLIHRVPVVDGKPKAKDGAYVLHDDANGRAGYVENFKTGEKATFGERSEVINNVNRDQLEAIKADRAVERVKLQNDTAKTVDYLVKNKFTPATAEHPYLQKKGVEPHSAKIDNEGALIVPLMNIKGELRSFQRINEDGRKTYISGGQKSGCFHTFGTVKSNVIICEGFATGASIYEATKTPTVCAMDAGNLKSVAVEIRQKYGEKVNIVIAGDDDIHQNPKNPGKACAEQAAAAVKGKVIIPQFTPDEKLKGLTDFNDLHQSRGQDAVKEQLGKALQHEKIKDDHVKEMER